MFITKYGGNSIIRIPFYYMLLCYKRNFPLEVSIYIFGEISFILHQFSAPARLDKMHRPHKGNLKIKLLCVHKYLKAKNERNPDWIPFCFIPLCYKRMSPLEVSHTSSGSIRLFCTIFSSPQSANFVYTLVSFTLTP